MVKRLFLPIFISYLLLISASPAYAYLDAGSGSMLLQLILGGVAGLAVAGKFYWQKIVGLFRRKKDIES